MASIARSTWTVLICSPDDITRAGPIGDRSRGRVSENHDPLTSAGFLRRAVAAIADAAVLAMPYLLFAATLSPSLARLLDIVVGTAYFVLLEGASSGQTVGKGLAGVRVVDAATGESIGYGAAALRFLGRGLSAVPLGLGYWWMLWDPKRQTWHDKLAYSVVVDTHAARVPEEPPGGLGTRPAS